MLMGSHPFLLHHYHPASEPVEGCCQGSERHSKAESRPYSQSLFPPLSPCWDGKADSLPFPLGRVQASGGGMEIRHKEELSR